MKKNLSTVVSVRFSVDEFASISDLAEANEEKYITSFIRKIVMDCVENEKFRKKHQPKEFIAVDIVPIELHKDTENRWYLVHKYHDGGKSKKAILEYLKQGKDRFVNLTERREITHLKDKLTKAIQAIEKELK